MNFTPKLDNTAADKKKKAYESITKFMATELITFRPDQEVGEVINTLEKNEISGAPVLDENRELVGMISEQDCLKFIIDSVYHNQPISKGLVKDYMNRNIITIPIHADVVDAADMFLKYRFRRFPIVDEQGKLIGQVSKRDVLRAAKKMQFTTW
jgi:CBS domain-containing protein